MCVCVCFDSECLGEYLVAVGVADDGGVLEGEGPAFHPPALVAHNGAVYLVLTEFLLGVEGEEQALLLLPLSAAPQLATLHSLHILLCLHGQWGQMGIGVAQLANYELFQLILGHWPRLSIRLQAN